MMSLGDKNDLCVSCVEERIASEYLDDKLFAEFKSLEPFSVFSFFNLPKDIAVIQKNAFLNGDIENPNLFSGTKLEFIEDFNYMRKKLLDFKDRILFDNSIDTYVKMAYLGAIDEKLKGVDILESAFNKDFKAFNIFNIEAYGAMNKNLYSYFIHDLYDDLKLCDQNSDIINDAKIDLLSVLPAIDNDVVFSLPEVSDTIVDSLSVQVHDLLAKVIDLNSLRDDLVRMGVDGSFNRGDYIFDSHDIAYYFDRALVLTGIEKDGWSVVIDENKSMLMVSAARKTIIVPANRQLSLERLKALVLHEMTHVIRSVNGSRSKLRLLSTGLAGYLKTEEGITTTMELVLENKFGDEIAKRDRYLAMSFALGLDGGVVPNMRNFREVFTIMQKYYYFEAVRAGKLSESALSSSNDDAYNICFRIFRGTPGNISGMVYMKDKVYSEGSFMILDYLSRLDEFNDGELEKMLHGKFSITSESHRQIVDALR